MQFNIHGNNTDWGEEVYNYTRIEATETYPSSEEEPILQAKAVIDAGPGGLNDVEGWHIVRYTVGKNGY